MEIEILNSKYKEITIEKVKLNDYTSLTVDKITNVDGEELIIMPHSRIPVNGSKTQFLILEDNILGKIK